MLGQTSHRQPNPKPPRGPNDIFDQFEKQNTESAKQQPGENAAARQQREANRMALSRELPQLIDLAQNLQKRLDATDLNAALPADLQKQAKELERVARQVHKRIRSL